MLVLVDTTATKKRAQSVVEKNVRSSLRFIGTRNIGFPAGNFDRKVYSLGDGELWAAFSPPDQDGSTRRYWNGFGIFEEGRAAQNITVEINIPLETNAALVAGFFAQDPANGATYLMHSGKVGGGRKGIGKSAFLAWSKSELVKVADGEGNTRSGIIIGNIDGADLTGRIWRFVQLVSGFKEAVSTGALDNDEFRAKVEETDRYRREFSGRKRGKRSAGEIDYLSYHGDIVDALFEERSARQGPGEVVASTVHIDLFVKRNGALTEIYEIKPKTDRDSLYKAIGQLMTHSAGSSAKRWVVLPTDQEIMPEFRAAFAELAIAIRLFRVDRQRSGVKVTLIAA
ncbi:hypothetical protein [Bosea sp. RAC05]|uniref:hypothetical protein n=1 Tax=Bosea sp. RAC05 TaxID=1842539 RepID=UPI00083D81C7|nr:hypothetical protein [Bosea sp. RAC05]AOG02809.1 hypothetical protein BSY19_5137 [Bosea sp. RAC05]